jgi:hypothetical protein
MFEVITNSQTGEITIRDFTPEEIAARTPDPAMVLAEWRATAKCTRMQGILALGEARWAMVLEYRATATWAEKIVIDDASDWNRASQNIAFFGYLLGLSDADIDALFTAAEAISA